MLNGIDAFQFFMKPNNNISIKRGNEEEENKNEKSFYITLKEMFDAFDHFYPKKYSINTILKYLNKYFNITLPNNSNNQGEKKDIINYDEFNYF